MNVSLLREKPGHGQERRGSRMSVRLPSRQPSMASLRPHSPNPSLGKCQEDDFRNWIESSNDRKECFRVYLWSALDALIASKHQCY